MQDRETPETLLQATGRRAGWAMVIRGAIAVIFGILALRFPTDAARAFVVLFAIFAFADGVLDFVVASALGRMGQRWGWYVFGGLVSVAAGVTALVYPHATLLVILLLVAIRAIMIGITELGLAFTSPGLESRWLIGLAGLVSVMFGILLFASPRAGGFALLWTIGVYAIVFGAAELFLGARFARTSRELPARS